MNKQRTVTLVASLGLLLMAITPIAAQADGPALSLAGKSSSATIPTGAWVDADGYIRLPRNELETLASTQTQEEIELILASGEPANTLLNPETGTYLAAAIARKASDSDLRRAITPGCGFPGNATVSRYFAGSSLSTCYNGTGQLNVNHPNTFYLAAGQYSTSFFNPQGPTIYVPSFLDTTLTSTITVTKILR